MIKFTDYTNLFEPESNMRYFFPILLQGDEEKKHCFHSILFLMTILPMIMTNYSCMLIMHKQCLLVQTIHGLFVEEETLLLFILYNIYTLISSTIINNQRSLLFK